MSLAILFHFLCTQHVSDINMSVIRGLRLFCSITTLVVLFLYRCVLEIRSGWFGVVSVLQAEAHKKWNKISSDIKLVFYCSTITMMHGPINISVLMCWGHAAYMSEIWLYTYTRKINRPGPSSRLWMISIFISVTPGTGCCYQHWRNRRRVYVILITTRLKTTSQWNSIFCSNCWLFAVTVAKLRTLCSLLRLWN